MNLEVLIGLIGIGVATMAMIGGLLTFRELEGRNASPELYRPRTEEHRRTDDTAAHTGE